VENLCTFLNGAHVFNGIENIRVAGGQYNEKLTECRTGDDHENDSHGLRETARSLDPGHPITERGEFCNEGLGVGGSDETYDYISKGNHGLNLHANQGPEAVPGKIGKQVPVIPKIGYDYACREKPNTGLCNTDPAGKVCMSPVNVDSPDSFEAGLYDPCEQDKEG